MRPSSDSGEYLEITSNSNKVSSGLRDLWRQRELLGLLVHREIFARYRQSFLGVFWIVIEPLAILAIMTAVFSLFLRVDTGGVPYPLFAFTALVPWMLFSKTLTSSSSSLDKNLSLAAKARVSRLTFPVSESIRELVDSAVLIFVLVAFSIFLGYPLSAKILIAFPLFMAIATLALGIGLWIAGLMVRVRDFRFVLAIAIQAGLYATPIFYPPNVVPEQFQAVYQLNPMYWAVMASRNIFLDSPFLATPSLLYSMLFAAAIAFAGFYLFNFMQRTAIDVQ